MATVGTPPQGLEAPALTIQEVKVQKHALEENILLLLRAFEERTGTRIKSVHLRGYTGIVGAHEIEAVSITTEV